MESKVCSRSQGQPPGARRRSMIATARSKRSPVVDIPATNVNDHKGGRQCSSGDDDATQIGEEAEIGSSGRQSHRKGPFPHDEDKTDRRPRPTFVEDLEDNFGAHCMTTHIKPFCTSHCISSAMARDFTSLTAPCAVAIIEMRGGAVW